MGLKLNETTIGWQSFPTGKGTALEPTPNRVGIILHNESGVDAVIRFNELVPDYASGAFTHKIGAGEKLHLKQEGTVPMYAGRVTIQLLNATFGFVAITQESL